MMVSESKASRWNQPAMMFAGVAVLALVVRLLVLMQVRGDPNVDHLTGDGAAYWRWADSILGGDWIGKEVFYQTPLYPYFLAIVRGVLRLNQTGVRVIQACIGACACGVLALGARKLLNTPAGWIAGILPAIYPPAISYDLQIDKPVLDVALACLLVWGIASLYRQINLRALLITGAACGFLSLNRENALVLVPILAIWVWFRTRRFAKALIFVAASFAVILPVAIRNSVIGHGMFLATAQFGPNFYIGNNSSADGAYHPLISGRGDAMYERADATEIAQRDTGRTLSPGEVSHYWAERTLHDIAETPLRWIALIARKFAMVFANSEMADSDAHDRFVAWSPVLTRLDDFYTFGVLTALAAVGLAIWPDRRALLIFVAMIAALAVTMSLFFIFGRYRMAIVPMLVVPASAGLSRMGKIRAASVREIAIAVFALVAAIGWVALGEHAMPAAMHGLNAYNRAKYLAERGQFNDAESLYRHAIDQNPNLSPAYNNLGLLLLDRGRVRDAIPLLNNAIRLEPTDPAAQINLGMALAEQNDLDDAIEHFRRALELSPTSTAARYNLGAALMMRGDTQAAIDLLKPFASETSPDPFARRAALLLKKLPSPATQSSLRP
jgi:tetratricopeptide (TPR) repeat protein